jgi:fructose-bisphosphate aldolase class II
MKSLKYYLQKAVKEGWALGQFNFSDFTQMKAIIEVAKEMNSPIILGTSEGESKFFGLQEAVSLRDFYSNKFNIPIFLNLDHGKSFEYLKQAIDAGYDMVHFDGSKLSFEENEEITKKVVKYASKKGVLVEGEMGRVGNDASKLYSEKFQIKQEDLTDPDQAKKYIKLSKVDLLAISIGNFHGIEISGIDPNLKLDILESIKQKTGKLPLVLHGGSGTPEDDIKSAIKLGIAKININTELRLAFSGNIRRALDFDKEEIVPYKFLAGAKSSVQKVVKYKISLFGSENKA